MNSFSKVPHKVIELPQGQKVYDFYTASKNIDLKTVESFGAEWEKFDSFTEAEIKNAGDQYFDLISEQMLNESSVVLDMGCGSGRWTKYVAGQVNSVEAVDPSKAIFFAAKTYSELHNVRFSRADVENLPFHDNTFNFVFSLGVLHHIPDTEGALKALVSKLKPDGYALIYLYYALDNRGLLFKAAFYLSSFLRLVISKLPSKLKQVVCDFLALTVYLPLVSLSRLIKKVFPGNGFKKIPLAYYHDKSWNIIRNDALDRFGTPLEQRFSKIEIKEMLEKAGMHNIVFSDHEPYWHLVAQKK